MPNMEFAGVEYTEKEWDSSSAITGVDYSICGMMIVAQKGPINEPVLVTSLEKAKEIFGSCIKDAFGMYAIEGFYKNAGNGAKLYLTRHVHYEDIADASTITAKKASVEIKEATNTNTTIKVIDKYHGALGNSHGVKIVDTPSISEKTIAEVASGAKTVQVKVIMNFNEGDSVAITDGTNTEYAKIVSIDVASRTLTLDKELTKTYAIDSTVKTTDFTVEVYEKTTSGDKLCETFDGVNMDSESDKYIVTVVNDKSKYIEIEDEYLEIEDAHARNPIASENVVYLTGGNDGLDGFCDADIIGDKSSKTGFHAWDTVEDMVHVCCPESCSKDVNRAGYEYWENRMTGMFFGYVPSGLNTEEAATYRDEAGWDTSYGALYYNHGYVTDPIGKGSFPQKLIPLTGHILGAMCRNDRTDEDAYGSAPAGEKVVLKGVNSLEFKVDKTNGGILYGNKNRNVNPIVSLNNNGGICVWGSRTQSSKKKWMQILARRVFIYAEISITNGTRWAAFRTKTDKLYREMNRTVNAFLSTVKGLDGNTDKERFEFVCNSEMPENNNDEGYLVSRVGLNIVGVAEFIYFEFGQKPEGISLSEV